MTALGMIVLSALIPLGGMLVDLRQFAPLTPAVASKELA